MVAFSEGEVFLKSATFEWLMHNVPAQARRPEDREAVKTSSGELHVCPGVADATLFVVPPSLTDSANQQALDPCQVGIGRDIERDDAELLDSLAVDAERREQVDDRLAAAGQRALGERYDTDCAVAGPLDLFREPQNPVIVSQRPYDVAGSHVAREPRVVVDPYQPIVEVSRPQSLATSRRPTISIAFERESDLHVVDLMSSHQASMADNERLAPPRGDCTSEPCPLCARQDVAER